MFLVMVCIIYALRDTAHYTLNMKVVKVKLFGHVCSFFFYFPLPVFFLKIKDLFFNATFMFVESAEKKIHKNIFSFNVSTQCLPEITVTQSQTAIVTLNSMSTQTSVT